MYMQLAAASPNPKADVDVELADVCGGVSLSTREDVTTQAAAEVSGVTQRTGETPTKQGTTM
jgi:hypothetical protein